MSSSPASIRARAEQMINVLREFGPIDEKAAAALLRWTNTKMSRNPPAKDKVFDFVFRQRPVFGLASGRQDGWPPTAGSTGLATTRCRPTRSDDDPPARPAAEQRRALPAVLAGQLVHETRGYDVAPQVVQCA